VSEATHRPFLPRSPVGNTISFQEMRHVLASVRRPDSSVFHRGQDSSPTIVVAHRQK
jgi:hypothetical protein